MSFGITVADSHANARTTFLRGAILLVFQDCKIASLSLRGSWGNGRVHPPVKMKVPAVVDSRLRASNSSLRTVCDRAPPILEMTVSIAPGNSEKDLPTKSSTTQYFQLQPSTHSDLHTQSRDHSPLVFCHSTESLGSLALIAAASSPV